jgi:hypothetical protein
MSSFLHFILIGTLLQNSSYFYQVTFIAGSVHWIGDRTFHTDVVHDIVCVTINSYNYCSK